MNIPTNKNLTKSIICITGKCEIPRKEFECILAKLGATCQENVTLKTTTVIIGGHGSPKWKYGDEGGTKLARAYDLIDKGQEIEIVLESEFLRTIN